MGRQILDLAPGPDADSGITGGQKINDNFAELFARVQQLETLLADQLPDVYLGALTLSGGLQVGVPAAGDIIGATFGSTVVSNIPGISINSGQRTYSGTPSGSAGTIANGLAETLQGAINSPRETPVTVAAAAGVIVTPPPTATVDNTLGTSNVLGNTVAGFAVLTDILDQALIDLNA